MTSFVPNQASTSDITNFTRGFRKWRRENDLLPSMPLILSTQMSLREKILLLSRLWIALLSRYLQPLRPGNDINAWKRSRARCKRFN